ncbi:MAG TPA: AMP-binding protein, partial [Steroidobacteraceae bacterium]|nr:AMP-binding protein [Steroidobacteraceae bacterium]
DRVARGFLALGLAPGERIGIWSPNNLEWVLTQFAAARAGLVLVNINPAYRGGELAYVLRKVGCRALIFAPHFKTSDYGRMIEELLLDALPGPEGLVANPRFPELRRLIRLGAEESPRYLPFERLTALAASVPPEALERIAVDVDPDDPTNIQFTSGTTGAPKGATLSHFNIVNNGYFVGRGIGLGPDDRLCIPVPLYHCFGMVMGVLGAATNGATMVFPAEAFDPLAVLSAVAEERCTALYGVPTMFIAELDHPRFREFDLRSLRTGIMAGATCPIAVMRRVIDEMYMREITICYGMTETSPVSFQSRIGDPLEQLVSTVGRIHPHLQAKVIDADGRVAPRGARGELLTRGYSVMRGYWDDPAHTAQAVDEAGWMHTGDLATIDAEGYCTIVGRVKDMIIRGGENVYPREIEEFLHDHPKVLDVAVVGVPDEKYGEEVCAVIRLREDADCGPEEIIAYCRGRIAHFKVPRYVRFVDEFPMTVTGKIQKYLIREQMESLLAAAAGRDA